MDSIFGLVGKDFAILASDMAIARSILVYKHDVDKIVQLDSHKIMVGGGVQADNVNFAEYIQKNFKLYELSNDLKLSTKASANFVRNEVSQKITGLPWRCAHRGSKALNMPLFFSYNIYMLTFYARSAFCTILYQFTIACHCVEEGTLSNERSTRWLRRERRYRLVLDGLPS